MLLVRISTQQSRSHQKASMFARAPHAPITAPDLFWPKGLEARNLPPQAGITADAGRRMSCMPRDVP